MSETRSPKPSTKKSAKKTKKASPPTTAASKAATSKAPPAKKRASPSKARAAKPAAQGKAALPRALAERAKAAHAQKQARLAAQGRAAIARIKECKVDIAANAVDMGLALAELKTEGIAEALGRSGFAEVCELDLEMSTSSANVLVALATKVPREVVTHLGPDRARALLELVEATPENESIEDLLRSKLALPSGTSLDVADADTKELREAAKELRDARAVGSPKRSRGFTASPAEKKTFAAIAKRLKASGHKDVKLIAGRRGEVARLRFEVAIDQLSAFTAALAAAIKG